MSGPYHPAPGDTFDTIAAAAFSGDPECQFRLAEIHRRGLFQVPVDEVQALGWYRRAAEAGHRTAAFILNNWRNRHQFL